MYACIRKWGKKRGSRDKSISWTFPPWCVKPRHSLILMSVRLGPVRPQRHLLLSLRRPLILKKWNWHLWCDGRARVATLNRNNKSPVRERDAHAYIVCHRGAISEAWSWTHHSSWNVPCFDRLGTGAREIEGGRGCAEANQLWIEYSKDIPKCLYIYLVVLSITFSFLFSTFLSIVAGKTPYQDSSLSLGFSWIASSSTTSNPRKPFSLSTFPDEIFQKIRKTKHQTRIPGVRSLKSWRLRGKGGKCWVAWGVGPQWIYICLCCRRRLLSIGGRFKFPSPPLSTY